MINKIIVFVVISISLLGCKSHKEIKRLSSEINCNKEIHFVWDDDGDFARTEKRGMHKDSYARFFKGKKLNYKEVFIESIDELNRKYNGKFTYKEYHGFPSDSIIQVTVKLEKIIFNMGFSKLTKDTRLVFSNSNQIYPIIGSSAVRGKKGLLECFEHANLQFLLIHCRN